MCKEDYEYGPIEAIGGATGQYLLRTPYNTECEWCLYFASSSGNGMAIISSSNSMLQTTVSNPTLGLASGGMDNNALDGIVLQLGANFAVQPFEHWQPLGRGASLFVAVTLASGNAYFNVAFRRLSEKVIPRIANKKPTTHTPLSGHRQRTFMHNFGETSHMPGAAIDVVPEEDTSTSKGHMPPGKNPMAALDRRLKRG
jgi:hypothetical protein